MIANISSDQSCGACEDTGLVVLSGAYRIGRRVMQPQSAGCQWCEEGVRKCRMYPHMPTAYGIDDFDAPLPEPNLSDPRVRAACEREFQEFKRAFRAMQAASAKRARELREGAQKDAA